MTRITAPSGSGTASRTSVAVDCSPRPRATTRGYRRPCAKVDAPMEIEPGAVIANRYVLERPLARGGMGTVWVGRDTDRDTRVAVKFMLRPEEATPKARARFEQEARAAAALVSP